MKYEVGSASFIGTRAEQQDSMLVAERDGQLLAAVCDGMGGLTGGSLASATAVQRLKQLFEWKPPEVDFPEFYLQAVDILDESVWNLRKKMEVPRGIGTTMVSAAVDGGKLYWFNVGDSRMYIVRDQQIVRTTTDHNYFFLLDQALRNGEITDAEYNREARRGNALVSFIGKGGIEHMDISQKPLALIPGDRILLVSDGLYRCVPMGQIREVAMEEGSAQEIADRLMEKSKQNAPGAQDNTTIIVIKMTGD